MSERHKPATWEPLAKRGMAVWNAKRVMLLVAGFGTLTALFLVYAHFLGGIDGLPPLPPEYWPIAGPELPLEPPAERRDEAVRKLVLAFGERSDVLKLAIKLDMTRRGMVLATDDFKILEEDENSRGAGQVKLQPFRVALFGKARGPDGTPEINTISSDVAYLQFDAPVASLSDLSGRKIRSAELKGNITIVNNRRTPQQDDDLSLFTQGPLYYESDQDHIFTRPEIRIVDLQSKPQPATINAVGLDVYLTAEQAPAAGQAPRRKPKPETISGVESVRLRSAVEMHLFVDSQSGFLSAGKNDSGRSNRPPTAPPGKNQAAAQKAHLKITTDGPFVYYVQKDRAEFDISGRETFSMLPKVVEVIREHEQSMLDHLLCDHLVLQFHHKSASDKVPNATSQPAQGGGVDMEIESAHATAEPSKEVVLSSDGEALEAYGKDLYYDARTHTSILKGEAAPPWPQGTQAKPMRAVKDGHVIYARELQMAEIKPGQQQATVLGPGRIDLYDKKSDRHSVHARWDDQLTSGKEGGFDCLTLTGNAVFQDDEHDQRLRGDRLKVWLQPSEPGTADAGQNRAKPHHVEARGHVGADSAELHVTEPTETLVIWFKDVPASARLPQMVPAVPTNGPAPVQARLTSAPAGPVVSATPSSGPSLAVSPPTGLPTAGGKQPLYLSARAVESYVLRGEVRNDLERLWCEGVVRVRQEGATPEEHGVDITGDTLQLTHFSEGNVLVVTGNLAHVRMNETKILGPEVTIDQKTNIAQVHGLGFMSMPSRTDFNGAPLSRPAIMTVGWREAMLFDGKTAEFRGGVQAKQDNARLLCQEMQVQLDRAVSFKEGDKGKQPAKVQGLVCDRRVFVEDRTFSAGRLEAYKRLTAPSLSMDNTEERTTAAGPGMVHLLQLGSPDEAGPPASGGSRVAAPATAKSDPRKKVLELTRVSYRDRLYANNKSRTAIFYGDVRVVHFPTDNPDVKVDLDKPPPGLLYMTCEKLTVFTDATKAQQMEAESRVVVQSQEFSGRAEVVRYDEAKDQVIFIGSEGGPATLLRQRAPGQEPQTVSGRKITYWRKTNDVKIEEGDMIKASP